MTIGSKAFPESLILGEMLAHLADSVGARAQHERTRGLGGTEVLWGALIKGEIDVYAEYTGTISEQILKGRRVHGDKALRKALAEQGVLMSRPLGFINTYAIGMKAEVAERLGIRKISDLRGHAALKFGFSNEFMERADGWPSLRASYHLPQEARGMAHALAYDALDSGAIQATELYSTDAEIREYGLRVLEDDRHHFPDYQAVLLYRADLKERAPQVVTAFLRLEGTISERAMTEMNARVKLDRASPSQVAADFVNQRFDLHAVSRDRGLAGRLWEYTYEHLFLVGVSLAAAVLSAVPLGIVAAYRPRFGQVVLGGAGILQTVPSLALLVVLIPLVGLGTWPAIIALFLYSLLPIVRNTHAGLHDIPGHIRESAAALGLPWAARLRLVELPMASRAILAGIKTSAVINVGTATLGGFIGAGGYGQPIFTGIPLRDTGMVLEGAIPAAVLALVVQGLFELAERFLVPRGLRLRPVD
jgi:osmoprotectant transport system permease protein